MHFLGMSTPQIWKFFPHMKGNKSLRENSTNILETDKALGKSIEIWEDLSLRLILKAKGDNQDCLPFVDSSLGVEISSKKKN